MPPLLAAESTRSSPRTPVVRYLGCKTRVLDELMQIVGRPTGEGVFVDAFTGTGVVAAEAANRGWPVRTNDHLLSAALLSKAGLLADDEVTFDALGGYAEALRHLNESSPEEGFFWREYSPRSDLGRMYFTERNAARIDAIRALIRHWACAKLVTTDEHELLLADLIVAAGRVANTAGTYGCFLAHWTAAAKRPLEIRRRELRRNVVSRETLCGDVAEVPTDAVDTVYFDPPYTKRQYAAYYHVNETLAHEDDPEVLGVTGLRPWHDKASDYCYKASALEAIAALMRRTGRRLLLSYSSEGHAEIDDLVAAVGEAGDVSLHELSAIGRYQPNGKSGTRGQVIEYVLEVLPLERPLAAVPASE